MKKQMIFLSLVLLTGIVGCQSGIPEKPNIILCMSDDQGWGDVGFHGHPHLKTPNLDEMAANGIQFDWFYSAAPVCSPTRASCLTGRHPYRQGIFGANSGHMRHEELTLAEVLKNHGYTTGHFGKWHLGTLTVNEKDSNRGKPGDSTHYSPPWENGFDVCFSTEAKVPTWDPMITPDTTALGGRPNAPGEPYGTYYWEGEERKVTENLEGDDSRIIMDRVIPFIETAAREGEPFFAVIWFHTPHLPVLTGERNRNMYAKLSLDEQHFFGCITAMDEQIGRLRREIANHGMTDNTMIWFCSDNGPEGRERAGRTQGSAGPFTGRKRSLLDGGVRVPALLEWPDGIRKHRVINIPCSTSDYFPTILDILDLRPDELVRPLDGVSLLPMINGEKTERDAPIGFISGNQRSLVNDRYKLYSSDQGESYSLFDIKEDPGEKHDLIKLYPAIADSMKTDLDEWVDSLGEIKE
ncbi:MAG: sulfatase-like hydrolase/transferase [Bacteroidota bacterium]